MVSTSGFVDFLFPSNGVGGGARAPNQQAPPPFYPRGMASARGLLVLKLMCRSGAGWLCFNRTTAGAGTWSGRGGVSASQKSVRSLCHSVSKRISDSFKPMLCPVRHYSVFNSSDTVFALSSGHGKCGKVSTLLL